MSTHPDSPNVSPPPQGLPKQDSPKDASPTASQSEVPVALVLDRSALPEWITPEDLPVAELVSTESSSADSSVGITSAVPVSSPVRAAQPNAGSATPLLNETNLTGVPPTANVADGEQASTTVENQLPADHNALSPTTPLLTLEPRVCPACGCASAWESQFCPDCGYAFPSEEENVPVASVVPETQELVPGTLVAERYEIVEELSRRGPTIRYRARDRHNDGQSVILVQQGLSRTGRDTVSVGKFSVPAEVGTSWPGIGWEITLLGHAQHPGLPQVLDVVCDGESVFAVEESADGPDLWQVFDDPSWTMPKRFELLAELAECLKILAAAGAIPEYLQPELLRLNAKGKLAISDLSILVPLPYPPRTQIATTPYTPPELVVDPVTADARSPLYSFGATMYALYLGHELTESDFDGPWVPKPLVFRFPDAHPAYARIVMKTFVREKEYRFPTEEASRSDPTGWEELARALRSAGQQLNGTRLDVSGWSNTGKLRSNNEDAFAIWHTSRGFEEHLRETLLAVLCDGMGGYEAGEVAAAMAIQEIRQRFIRSDYAKPLLDDTSSLPIDPNACCKFLFDLLREVNERMYQFSRSPQGKRGMGCTCEVLFIHGEHAIVAHVGDSRTYHYSDGTLRQLTRDQTLVNRLVELGQLTPEEAENHPRKNELQQALGAQPFVEPQTICLRIKPGDWIVLCSDGVTNHVDEATLAEMIQRADSAEMCTRRLVNLANAYGGSDNSTVIAVRCQ